MDHRAPRPAAPSLAALLGGIMHDAKDLLVQRLRLAKLAGHDELRHIKAAALSLGIGEYEAKRYEGKIKEGNVLISVHTEDSTERARAKTIFEQPGAEDISYTEEARV